LTSGAAFFEELNHLSRGGPEANLRGIFKLRNWLNEARAKLPSGYMNQAEVLSAYLSFYLPLHVSELAQIIRVLELRGHLNLTTKPKSILDLGAGPGTASLSIALAFSKREWLLPSFTLVEQSKRALDFAHRLGSTLGAEFNCKRDKLEGFFLGNKTLQADWVVLSHVLNEWGSGPRNRDQKERILAEAMARVKPGGLLFVVEPPKRETTLDLMSIRDRFVEEGYSILAPCPQNTSRCPMILRKAGWCHRQEPRTEAYAGLSAELASWDKRVLRATGVEWTHSGFSYLVVQQHLQEASTLVNAQMQVEAAGTEKAVEKVYLTDEGGNSSLICTKNTLVRKPITSPFRGAIEKELPTQKQTKEAVPLAPRPQGTSRYSKPGRSAAGGTARRSGAMTSKPPRKPNKK
jgi:ribosomal protein RSM22 (predicted rRNA methylase)